MDVRDFDFDLPPELIAQEPSAVRGGARLLCLDRATGSITHTQVRALPTLLRAGDLVVVNNTRVFPARLLGRRVPSGGAVECLLVNRQGSDEGQTGVRMGVRHPSDPIWHEVLEVRTNCPPARTSRMHSQPQAERDRRMTAVRGDGDTGRDR